MKLPIERSKSLVRFFEKRKLNLDLMHSKGFMRKDTPLGHLSVELSALLNTCEYHAMLDVTVPLLPLLSCLHLSNTHAHQM